jgi:hypothetical protein
MSCERIWTAGLLLALACACRSTADSVDVLPAAAKGSELPEPVLYARDGTPVHAASPLQGEPRREALGHDSSRMYLLELYQKTVEEKDSYAHEIQGLQAMVARAAEVQTALEKERDEARTKSTSLSKDLEQARADNADLAARLVTAQIRRLEAEKLLLEARIEALKHGPAPAGPAPSAPAKPAAGTHG